MRKESKVRKVGNTGIREQCVVLKGQIWPLEKGKLCKDMRKVRKSGLWSYEGKTFQAEVVNSAKAERQA